MSLFDLGFVVNALSDTTLSVQRFSAHTYSSQGIALPRGPLVPFTALGSVQPIPGAETLDEAGGARETRRFDIFCVTPLELGDVVTALGASYEVETLQGWQSPGNYFRATARALDESEQRP